MPACITSSGSAGASVSSVMRAIVGVKRQGDHRHRQRAGAPRDVARYCGSASSTCTARALEPGCLLHSVHHDVEDPNRLVFVEHWADHDALDDALPRAGVGRVRDGTRRSRGRTADARDLRSGAGAHLMPAPVRRWAVVVAFVSVVAACGGGHSDAAPTSTSTSTSGVVTSTTPPTTAPHVEPVLAAQAIVPALEVFDTPDVKTPARVLPNPWQVDPHLPTSTVPQVFLVAARQPAGWVKVLLPIRPNGSAGWVTRRREAHGVAFRVRVELGARRIVVLEHDRVRYQGPVAVGAAATPTPTGHYYIRVLIKALDPTTVYGPYAYGLSSQSDRSRRSTAATPRSGSTETTTHRSSATTSRTGASAWTTRRSPISPRVLPLGTPVDVVA